MTDTSMIEQLALEKAQLRGQVQSVLSILGVAASLYGKETTKGKELRFTKAQIEKLQGVGVSIRPVGKGGLVVEVADAS